LETNEIDAGIERSPFAGFLQERGGMREVARDARAITVCTPEQPTASIITGIAGLVGQSYSTPLVSRHSDSLHVQLPKLSTPEHRTARTSFLQKRLSTHDIHRNSETGQVMRPQLCTCS
jgi:hypothetical protein